jgi:hypothetical protein
MGNDVTLHLLLQPTVDPVALRTLQDGVDAGLAMLQRALVEIGGVREVRKEQ